jgi:NitT/TauT family transport system substrate-binding protein
MPWLRFVPAAADPLTAGHPEAGIAPVAARHVPLMWSRRALSVITVESARWRREAHRLTGPTGGNAGNVRYTRPKNDLCTPKRQWHDACSLWRRDPSAVADRQSLRGTDMRRVKHAFGPILFTLVAALAPARAETIVNISSANLSLGHMAQRLAESRGYFKEEGLEPKTFDFKGGGPAIQAVAGGAADLCICTGDHVVLLGNNGIHLRVLVSVTQVNSYALIARADSPYTDLASLKGQPIGITSSGSSTDNVMRFAIGKLGMDADKDFTLLSTGTSSAMEPAIEAKQVAAGMLTTPDFTAFLHSAPGKYKIVQDFSTMPYPTSSYLVMDDWLKTHGDEARRIARAVTRALALIHNDENAVREDIHKTYPNFDESLVDEIAKMTQVKLTKDGKLGHETWQNINDILTGYDPKLKPLPYEYAAALEYLPGGEATK